MRGSHWVPPHGPLCSFLPSLPVRSALPISCSISTPFSPSHLPSVAVPGRHAALTLPLSLALPTTPVLSCPSGLSWHLQWPERVFVGSCSRRDDHQQLVNSGNSLTSDTVFWGNFEFTCTLIGNQKINSLTCSFHFKAVTGAWGGVDEHHGIYSGTFLLGSVLSLQEKDSLSRDIWAGLLPVF